MTVERGHRSWQLHIDGHLVADDLAAALDDVAVGGGGPVFVWVSAPTPEDDRIAQAGGLHTGRDLYQLRVPLPLEDPKLEWRAFVPGQDDQEWLDVNNRAFAWHPEQGGWTLDMLHERMQEPWFDPAGFVVHERDGRMAGFCWTKVHPPTERDPELGEIYVIAVDPDFGGHGLGRQLTLAGLDWLHRARGIDVGMLFVDGSNAPAMKLYEHLGFEVHHIDRAYSGEISPR